MTTHSPPLPASTPHLAHIHCALLPHKVNAFNEAMAALPSWPSRQPPAGSGKPAVQTVYGRRRLDWFSRHANGFAQELRKAPLVKQLAGSRWTCQEDGGAAGAGASVTLASSGDVKGLPLGTGRWGTLNDPTLGASCPVYHCLFVDFPRGQMNARVDEAGATLRLSSNPYLPRHQRPPWTCVKA